MRPTWRSMSWMPLVAATVIATATLATARLFDTALPTQVAGVAVALLVIAGSAGLVDVARDLVHASPTPAWRRTGHRLALDVPASIGAVVAVEAVTRALYAGHGTGTDPLALVALASATIAGIVVTTRVRGAAAASTVVAVAGGWVVVGPMLSAAGVADVIAAPWSQQPLATACAAGVVTTWALLSGVEA